MGVSLERYRACIECFNIFHFSPSSLKSNSGLYFSGLICISAFILFCLILSGDIEINPGPVKHETTLSVCHWNLNSVWVDKFSKISNLSAFLHLNKFDIVCLGETFLNSEIRDNDPRQTSY